MANATLTPVAGGNYVIGNKRVKTYDVTLTASYTATGDSATATQLGFKTVLAFIPHGPFRKTSDDSAAVSVSWKSTGKLLAYQTKDPANAGGADVPLQIV